MSIHVDYAEDRTWCRKRLRYTFRMVELMSSNGATTYRRKKQHHTHSLYTKADHKHKYAACLIRSTTLGTEHLALGGRCSVCGQQRVTKFFVLEDGLVVGPEQFRAKYPGLPIYDAQK